MKRIAAVVCSVLLGCGSVEPSEVPIESASDVVRQPLLPRDTDTHRSFRQLLARRVPGFAGLYIENGLPHLRLAATGNLSQAREELRAYMTEYSARTGVGTIFDPERLIEVPSKYSYGELDGWLSELSKGGWSAAIHMATVDEKANALLLRAETEDDARLATTLAVSAGVPLDAFRVELKTRYIPTKSLQGEWRPTHAGVRIRRDGVETGGCSLGFNVSFANNTKRGFVTASHCTSELGRLDGATGSMFEQSGGHAFGWDDIGRETFDPAFTPDVPNCPAGGVCRRSDSALGEYSNASNAGLGRIARGFVECGPVNGVYKKACGGTCVDKAAPCSTPPEAHLTQGWNIAMVHTWPSIEVGTPVHKTGQTTGETVGNVTYSHWEVPFAIGTNYFVLFYSEADVTQHLGDSGAPVFAPTGDGNAVVLLGLAFGGNEDWKPTGGMLFSMWHYIHWDLGNSPNGYLSPN